MSAAITIIMPAFRGEDFIAEAIRSIRAQTTSDWTLQISVDGQDVDTARVAREFCNDDRIAVTVQDRRLGWPGNFNWLVRKVKEPFMCYWQQDDLASTTYLEDLHAEMVRHHDASIAYTDVQWFGARFERDSLDSIIGSPLERVLAHTEAIRYEPLRGLIRVSMLPDWPDAIPVTDDEGCHEEFVFLAALAAAGDFRRVPSAMYFKRMHSSNAFVRWAGWPEHRRRRGWISMGRGLNEIALSLAEPDRHARVTACVVDRLAVDRPGRAYFYLPPQTDVELQRFVHDFVAARGSRVAEWGSLANSDLMRPVDPRIVAALREEERLMRIRQEIAALVAAGNDVVLDARDPRRLYSMLGYGWSHVESWGVWSDGEWAEILVPTVPHAVLEVSIEAHGYGGDPTAQFDITMPGGGRLSAVEWSTRGDSVNTLVTTAQADGQPSIRIRPHRPISPRTLTGQPDARALGIGVRSIRFSPQTQTLIRAQKPHSGLE